MGLTEGRQWPASCNNQVRHNGQTTGKDMQGTARETLVNALHPYGDSGRDTGDRCRPLPAGEALCGLGWARNLDEIMEALLRGAASWLRNVEIYATRDGGLFGEMALCNGRLDRQAVRDRVLGAGASDAVSWMLTRHRGAMITVQADDPIGHLTGRRRLVMQPVRVDSRCVCLVVGCPRDTLPANVQHMLGDLDRMARAAADAMLRLIVLSRSGKRRPSEVGVPALPT